MIKKSIHEINKKIADGSINVVTAEEMVTIVEELGAEGAAKEVDVVTTGTFGAMCSSGLMLNLGHSEPPIKIQKVWFNNVEAYSGLAAVDAYLGAAQISDTRGIQYGGAHVIEDLLRGKEIDVHATAYGTDCYPRKVLDTTITLEDLNEAILLNPRNAYQKYAAATNSSKRTLNTYMGELLPNFGNVTYSGAGVLSPLSNDPEYETIGMGTRIFIGGAQGYVIGNGTQHSPSSGFGTLMLKGNLKK
jgi:L-aspartate semialdehyde sulfurtransferase